MNPEVNSEIQELKKEIKEYNQLLEALISVTDEGGTLNSESMIIRIIKSKLENKK